MTSRAPLRSSRWVAPVIAATLLLASCGGGGSSTSTSQQGVAQPAAQPSAAALQAQYIAAVKATQPQVVQIATDAGLGSGVIFDGKGDVVTNAHVLQGATRIQVTLADG